MTQILHITSSLDRQNSTSNKLCDLYLSRYLSKYPDTLIVKRDLGQFPVPHLDSDALYAFHHPEGKLSDTQELALTLSNQLIEEVQKSDILLLGVPMYNHGIPSPLKAWIDHIVRARVTFQYEKDGTITGYLTGKKVIICAARGGYFAGTDLDVQTPYLRNILSFIGLEDIRFIYAEGLAINHEIAAEALRQASSELETLIAAA